MTIYYDNRFNQNEWYVVILVLISILVFFLPKRFPLIMSAVFFIYGIAIAEIWDQIIGSVVIDLYDVNDNSKFQLVDFLLYFAYGPYSYFIVYFYDKFKLKKQHIMFYISALSFISLGMEELGNRLQVFHYKNGYQLHFSFPIYLVSYSILLILYFKLYQEREIGTVKDPA